VAIFFAAIIGYVMNANLTSEQIAAGGWRIPFFIGCLIVPFIFVIRRSLQETPEFLAQKKHPTSGEVFRSMVQNWQIVLLGMLLVVMTTVTFYLITVYTPTFGKSVLKLTQSESLVVTLCVAITNFIWLPIGGTISDRVGRKPVLLTIATLALLTAYPALSWLTAEPTFGKMLTVELWFSFFFGVYNGAMVAALSELVPAHVRASCFSLAFSLAAALFGTATPLVSTTLISLTGDKASPGYWLMFAGLCGIVSTLALYRGRAARNVPEPVAA
jgi:MHS family citrate/tricarballylate:H+ symporter-like MFS transporter